MLTPDGGWLALMLPEGEHAALTLKNGDGEAWRKLNASVKKERARAGGVGDGGDAGDGGDGGDGDNE